MLGRSSPRAGVTWLLAILLVVVPLGAGAQQRRKVPRIGILWAYSQSVTLPFADTFRRTLQAMGYVEGRTIMLEERWADGSLDRLTSLAAELVRLDVDVIVAASTPAVQAVQKATKTIPIVMTLVTDPVETGVVPSLARPGGNVTGLSLMHPELSGKRLALLEEIVPKNARVAGTRWRAHRVAGSDVSE